MTLKFYQYGADRLVATLELDEAHSSIIDKLNEPTRLSATLTSDTAPTLQLGARTTYKGITYYVTKEPTVRKEHSKLYTIELDLETVIGLARHVILDNPVDKRSSFDYTATASEHIQLVVDSLNGKKLRMIPAWTRGTIRVPDKVKHIKYDGISAWDALQLIRQTYETDIHIDGTAIDLGIWSDKNNAIELAYGKGNGILSGLERLKHDDTPTPMSLYVTGTKRNMVKGRLTMQQLETLKVDDNGNILHGDSASGRIFHTDKTGQYISEFTHDNGEQPLYTEATYTNEEIYPSHVSTIQSVTKVKDHFEVNSDFDYTSLRIEGEAMQVVFQSGNLEGRDFDAKHFASSGRLAIVPKEEDDTTLPNDTLCPKVGDQYIVTGIKLPDKYIREAQRKLTEDALSHLLKLQQQRYSYKAEIDPVYLHNNKTTIGTKLYVGQYVHLTDQQIAVGDPYIRIIAKRTYLDRPYTPEIELSNEVERLSLLEQFMQHADGVISVASDELSKRVSAAEASLGSKLDSGEFDKWREGAFKQVSGRITDAEGNIASQAELLSTHTEMLSSQAQLLADQGQQLTTHSESISSQSQRLTSAEQALTGKLDSGVFTQWQAGDYSQRQSALDKALASKQPAGSYALTSQLATSQQQAVAEAVKRAGEMDKAIKVGGRNLIRNGSEAKRQWGDWVTYRLYKPIEQSEPLTLSFDVVKVEKPPIGGRFLVYFFYYSNFRTATSVKYEEGKKRYSVSVQALNYNYDLYGDKKNYDPDAVFIYPNSSYDSGGGCFTVSNVKLERGTVATDWTPAPEDVEESVSNVNTSVTSLASTLLDPDQGEIHKLTSQLESHKTATDKSFAELSNHPLTIDENGYWQIWSVKDSKYLTTQYPSRGEAGQDAGRYLGRAKRIHPDFNGNYLLEPEGSSWQTAKEGDYVYLVGDAPNRGGDKDTYYIVREHKGNTVWEVYDIKGDKGDTPNLSLDEQYRLVADGVQVSPLSLKGEPGHSPSPDEVLREPRFRQLLTGEVNSQVTPISQRIDEVKTTADQASADLATANTKLEAVEEKTDNNLTRLSNLDRKVSDEAERSNLDRQAISQLKTTTTDLDKRSLTSGQKLDLDFLTNSLQALRSAGNTLEGLALQRLIALSGNGKDISAYLASKPMDAVLKAGITDFGQPTEREQVAINHNGTGHFGNLYFAGNQIDFRTSWDTAPYLSIGAEEATFIETFLAQARIVDTPVSVGSLDLTVSNAGYQRTLSVDNDGTRLTVTLDKIVVDVYGNSKLRLSLDGETLAEWVGDSKYIDTSGHTTDGGSSFRIERTPYKASNLTYERVVRAGNHTVRLEVVNPYNTCRATVNGLRVGRRYDTDAQQSALTKSGLRLFGSPDRYLDVDYRKLIHPSDKYSAVFVNPYLVRIVGGAKVDKLTADEVNVPGVPLCGASFNENGGQEKAFGKYVNRQGQARAQAVYYPSGDFYRVYHSIGNTNYIPTLQIVGDRGNDINWNLSARIYAVNANDFAVRILTNNDNPTKHAFSYVAFKTM